MAKSVVGRDTEKKLLTAALRSGKAELIALYGRRRVGKTHLVRNFVASRAATYLEVTGTRDGKAALQRRRFREAVQSAFAGGQLLPDLASWEDALSYLSDLVEQHAAARPGEPIVLFFDELPWLATPRSRLLESLDYHWNRRLSRIDEVKVILCGSAASWMLRRIVRARGGLHNRLTRRIRLDPFTVSEANAYLESQRVRLTRLELFELYMALGGVPYYLSLVERGCSVPEIVGQLCFERSGALVNEFGDVFASLFAGHGAHLSIVRALASKTMGLTRNELIAATGLSSGGGLDRCLQELEEAGFVARMTPYATRVKNSLYRLIDEYSLFFLTWMARTQRGTLARGGAAVWRSTRSSPRYRAWAGYAFESLCLKHAKELQSALGIDNLVTWIGPWRFIPTGTSRARTGAQVDLLLDRSDGVINLCEMKFSTRPFVVTKAYANELQTKLTLFEQRTRVRKRIVVTLVAPEGLKRNVWSEDLIDQVIDGRAIIARAG